jgi:hypothetical protein
MEYPVLYSFHWYGHRYGPLVKIVSIRGAHVPCRWGRKCESPPEGAFAHDERSSSGAIGSRLSRYPKTSAGDPRGQFDGSDFPVGHPEVGHPLVNVTAVGLVPLLPTSRSGDNSRAILSRGVMFICLLGVFPTRERYERGLLIENRWRG